MRQAGRYLPEYRAIRKRYSFLDLCGNPEAAAEVTLQPVRRFDLDAAILFTDLLIPVPGMGIELAYEPGPVLASTVTSLADVERLEIPDPERDLAPMLETARRVREELRPEVALIGFVGAPFTMACYLVEGRGSKQWEATRRMMHGDPMAFDALLSRIALALEPLVRALRQAGCDAIQVFDSWASVLSTEDYERRCAGHTATLLQAARDAGAVAINYVNGAFAHLASMVESPAHMLGVDWRHPMSAIRAQVSEALALQGNLDPTALFAPEEELRARVRSICDAAGPGGHVFNLGHGVLPQTDPRAIEVVVDEVRKS